MVIRWPTGFFKELLSTITLHRTLLICYLFQVILGDMDVPADDVYFIHSGKCRVVREITMIKKESSSGKIQLKLPPINFNENNIDNNVKEHVVRKFLSVHMLSKGDFFGVGEDLKKTFIISVGRVSGSKLCVSRCKIRIFLLDSFCDGKQNVQSTCRSVKNQ